MQNKYENTLRIYLANMKIRALFLDMIAEEYNAFFYTLVSTVSFIIALIL